MSANLLDTYGRKPIELQVLDGRAPANPASLQIGTEYVPPMAAVSVIDPQRVPQGHAVALAAQGYKPQPAAYALAHPFRDLALGQVLTILLTSLFHWHVLGWLVLALALAVLAM